MDYQSTRFTPEGVVTLLLSPPKQTKAGSVMHEGILFSQIVLTRTSRFVQSKGKNLFLTSARPYHSFQAGIIHFLCSLSRSTSTSGAVDANVSMQEILESVDLSSCSNFERFNYTTQVKTNFEDYTIFKSASNLHS